MKGVKIGLNLQCWYYSTMGVMFQVILVLTQAVMLAQRVILNVPYLFQYFFLGLNIHFVLWYFLCLYAPTLKRGVGSGHLDLIFFLVRPNFF